MRKTRKSRKSRSGSKPSVDVYQMVTDMIVSKLEEGVVPWHKPWAVKPGDDMGMFGPMGPAPRNLVSNKPYRGVNVFILGCQDHTSRYWLTYRQAHSLGGHVRKGEHGTMVVYWKFIRVSEEQDDGTKVSKRIPLLRYYTVFNLDQCEDVRVPRGRISDEPTVVPEPDAEPEPREDGFEMIEEAEAIVNAMPNRPEITYEGGRAFYRPSSDSVTVPERERFDSPAEYYNTLFHELVHATGHKSRVGRPGIMDSHFFGDHKYSREELVAEMGAAFLSAEAGTFEQTVDNSASYIDNWMRAIKDDKKMVVVAAGAAQRAADYICDRKREEDSQEEQKEAA